MTARPRLAGAAWLVVAGALTAGCSLTGFDAPRGAESILEGFSGPSPGEAAVMAQDPDDPSARYRGTVLLANAWFVSENPAYVEMFEDYLQNDENPAIRAVCARALGNHGGPEHAPLLADALLDEDEQVRIEAARALQRVHDPDVIPLLISRLEPPDEVMQREGEASVDVRIEVARALGQYERYEVVQALITALEDRDLAVNRAALSSLETLTGQDLALDTGAWLAWLDETDDPFAAGSVYVFDVYRRDRTWYEAWVPFIPPPPNETPGPPAGMERAAR